MAVSRPVRAWGLGPVLYGALFVVALPAGLVFWARALDPQLHLPIVRMPVAGGLLAAAGFGVWAAGVFEIIRRGGGLPMNAFPPVRYVASGVYAAIAHPIYVGWTMACAGVALFAGSASGLWVVTPAVAIGSAALVLGYERHDLRRRFGAQAIVRPWLSLPNEDASPPSLAERLACWFLVLLPWVVVRHAIHVFGSGGGALDLASAVIPLASLLTPTRSTLRRLVIQGLAATAVLVLTSLVSPATGGGAACHLAWAGFAAEAIAARSRAWAIAAWLWVVLFAVSVLAIDASPASMAWAVGLWLAVRRPLAMWRLALDGAEALANSWRAWRLGSMRIISHGVFAGLAAGVGVLLIGTLAGRASLASIVVLALSTLIGAGLWAQLVEGSPTLLRPFGYYGGIVGGLLGAAALAMMGQPIAVMLGATATAAPWAHALGRLRCLVQGCCHGGPTDPRYGIRVTNPHSRAVALAHLDGQPIHATPLYSIAGNVVMGVLLARVWAVGAPVWFIAGLYLMCAGLARFIEEGYRAEPQTMMWRGLPIYQHLAVASVVVGAVFTTWGGPPALAPEPFGDARVVAAALAMGALYWFAMGVDFPESSRRFARLSG